MTSFRLFHLRRWVADSLRSNSRSENDNKVLEAAHEDKVDLISEYLKECDHPLELRDDERRTLLHIAAMEGHIRVLRILLVNPKVLRRINAHDHANRTSLHLAAAMGHEDCIRALVDAGATMNDRDEEGRTPLHLAVKFAWPEAVKTLLGLGANTAIKDAYGKDPVELAKQTQDGEVSSLMMSVAPSTASNSKTILRCFPQRRKCPPGGASGPASLGADRSGPHGATGVQERYQHNVQDAAGGAGVDGVSGVEEEALQDEEEEETDPLSFAIAQAAREQMQLQAGQPAGGVAAEDHAGAAGADASAHAAPASHDAAGSPESHDAAGSPESHDAAGSPRSQRQETTDALDGETRHQPPHEGRERFVAPAGSSDEPAAAAIDAAAGLGAAARQPEGSPEQSAGAGASAVPKVAEAAPSAGGMPAVHEPCTAAFPYRAYFGEDVKSLGFQVEWKEEGPSVGSITMDGAADSCGLKPGDFISEINGAATSGKGRAELLPLLKARPLLLDVNRVAEVVDAQRQPHIELTMQVGGATDDRGFDVGWFGDIPSVCAVRRDSTAWAAGLLEGDGIVMANQCHVANSSQAAIRAELQRRPLHLAAWRRPLGEALATPWTFNGEAARFEVPAQQARGGDLTDSEGED